MEEQLAGLEVAYEELEQQNDELQTTREALERQRHRYRHLFDEAPFGYLVTDLNGTIEEANRAAAELLGVPQDHLSGKPFAVFLEIEDRPRFRALLPAVCAGEAGDEMEVRLKRRAGRPVTGRADRRPRLDAERRTARLRWTIRDVSKTKAAEEALRASEERLRHSQRLEAVGRLAGGIAHSFNNLLAAISFQCELLVERLPADDGRRAHVEEIQQAGERAAALARQLLAFGRKQMLQPRVLRLNDVLREMEPMLRRLIGEHIRLEIALDPRRRRGPRRPRAARAGDPQPGGQRPRRHARRRHPAARRREPRARRRRGPPSSPPAPTSGSPWPTPAPASRPR